MLGPQANNFKEVLRAVHSGEIDALVVEGSGSSHLFSLRGADQAYRVLVEEMAEGALTLTPDGVVVYANQHFAKLLGAPLQKVIGSSVLKAFAVQGRELLLTLLTTGLNSSCEAEMDLLRFNSDQRPELAEMSAPALVPVLVAVSPLKVNGLTEAVCMIVTDLTSQKRGAAAIQARENLLNLVESQRHTEEMLRNSLSALRLHESALAAISQAVVITDANLIVTYVNKMFEVMTGYAEGEVIGTSCKFLQGAGSSRQTLDQLKRALNSHQPFHGEILNYRKDGTSFWNELSIAPVLNAQGALTQYVGVQRDVTQRRLADEGLMLAAKIFEQSEEGFIITDAQRCIVKVNHAFTTITGFTLAEVMGQPMSMLNSEHHDDTFAKSKWAQVESAGFWEGETWKRRKNGPDYIQRLSLRKLTDGDGVTTHFIASFIDITEQKAAESRIHRLAHYDVLTGLPNRTLLQERATYALKLAQRSGESLALMFFDLDHFKNVNDSLGHGVGDQLLVEIGARLQLNLRDQDVLARMGGDEFVLILPGTDGEGAARVAHKLLHAMEKSFPLESHDISTTLSIGVALYPADGDDFVALSKCADTAMYRAKQSGRNTVQFYTPELQAHSIRTIALENGLRRALALDQFELHYQPQMSLTGKNIIGVEALLRWSHPVLGWVSPAEFIPVAESSGLITSIGTWVLKTATAQLRSWMDAGLPAMTMAVNLSAVQFRQPELPGLVSDILIAARLPAHLLELELTESVALDDPLGAIETMNTLNSIGVKMSIDDFGTGYSSLSYLKRFKVHKLKIDQSFVRNLADDAEDQVIVGVIIGLAKSLGLRVIAEGVETALQMEYLREQGCHDMQGYWFSRPLPADQLVALVRARAMNSAPAMGLTA